MTDSACRSSAGSESDDRWSIEEINRLIRQAAARRGWETRRQKEKS